MSEAEHLSVNVEAQIAHRLFQQSRETAALADGVREQAAAARKAAGELEDPVARGMAMRRVNALDAHARRLDQAAADQENVSRQAVARAESLDDDVHPSELQPITRRPVTKAEQAEREKLAAESAWANLRADRDALLLASDWTQQPDVPVERLAWAAYRQKLRDLPAKTKDPTKVEWPEAPR